MVAGIGSGTTLQGGPVVVTGISLACGGYLVRRDALQWGPVVVTGISVEQQHRRLRVTVASMGSGRGDRNQLTVGDQLGEPHLASMGSGRGDRNQCGPWSRCGRWVTSFNGVRSW